MSAFGRGQVSTPFLSAGSAAHYFTLTVPQFSTVANGNVHRIVYPFAGGGRLVDVIVLQVAAGTGGTSYTVDVKTAGGTSLLSTLSVSTLASGGNKVVDAKGEVALPSGWTRPIIKTDATPAVAKGAYLDITTVETGSYSPHATAIVTLVFEPLT